MKMLSCSLSKSVEKHSKIYFSLLIVISTFIPWVAISREEHVHTSYRIEPKKSQNRFFFIQIADPQFGVINGYSQNVKEALNWSKEKELFEIALRNVARLEPAFLLLTGDMQQFYPKNEGSKNGVLVNSPQAGILQANDVHSALNNILPSSIPVKFLPGNHDVDDAPDNSTLEYYHNTWGSNQYYSFWQGEIFFIVLNSQLYYDDSDLVENAKTKQTEWFQTQLKLIQEGIKKPQNIILLTHIPPFGGSPDEAHGWGNWKIDDRSKVLDIATSFDYWPTLWLCGHFHGNGRYYGAARTTTTTTKSIEVVVSNSVTCPMQWGGLPADDTYSATDISDIMSMTDAGDAFNRYVVPDFSCISGGSSKAGLRVVEVLNGGSYRHKWFSLDEITLVNAIDDESMMGATENAASWNDNNNENKGQEKKKGEKNRILKKKAF